MTSPPRLIDSAGRPLTLGRPLSSGGEGTVYLLPNDPHSVAKVYHDHKRTPQAAEKLAALVGIKTPTLLKVTAWPDELVFDASTRQAVGFLMPRVEQPEIILHLYNPVLRLKHFLHAGWAFQVRAAWNLAAAFEEVHSTGCVVGDVNPKNIFALQDAQVRIIDCDSFQMRVSGKLYRCEVAMPEFLPPELQGQSLDAIEQTANHDLFRLAVVIYSLLFVGRHPFSGPYTGPGDPGLGDYIREYRFTQGPLAKSHFRAPPLHTPTFADIPLDLGMLFRRAFERGSEKGNRPRPAEWMAALKGLEGNIVECRADPGHQHWKGQSRCVWCRLTDGGAPEYYIGAGGQSAGFAVDEKKLQEVLRRLAELAEPPPAPTRSDYRRGVALAGRPLSEQASLLKAAWESATTAAAGIISSRRAQEAREIQMAEANEAQILAEWDEEFDEAERKWEEEYDDARLVVADKWKDSQRITIILAVVAALGLVAVCAGILFNRVVAITGGIATAVFGVWLVVHFAFLTFGAPNRHLAELRAKWKRIKRGFASRREDLSDRTSDFRRAARAETDKVIQRQQARVALAEQSYLDHVATERRSREQRLQGCERVVAELERTLKMRADGTIGRHRRMKAELLELVGQCRQLATDYQKEFQRVVASAEANARSRHLRMHLLTDADIQGIGAGRKQTLMANGISTAADVTWNAVRGISGFGDTFTRRLVEWRSGIERTFTFNPQSATNSSEHRALVQQYRHRQNQYVTEMNRLLGELMTQMAPELLAQQTALRIAVAEWEQADADLRIMLKRG